MRRKKLLLPSMLFLLWLSASANAATLYVDNSGSPACANNPSNGTQAAPWCTVTYGISRMASGDILMVKAGTYNETFTITGPAGTSGAPTTVRTFPGATVTLRGSGVDSGRIKIENTRYITLDGFIVTNYNQGIHINSSDHIVVQNNTVYHVGQEGIHAQFNSSFVTIQNNTVHDTRQWQFNGEGIYVGSGSTNPADNTNNVIVKGNTVYNTNDESIEIKPGTHDNVVDGNNVSAGLLDPTFASPSSGSIEINEAKNVGSGNQNWPSNPNHIIRNNVVHDSKTAIRAGTGCTVYNNVVYNIASPYNGIYVDNLVSDSYTRKIYNNTVDIVSARAMVVTGGTADIKNNIGPATTSNLATSSAYFVNAAGHDYRLVTGAAPINVGADLTATVPTDIVGVSRSANLPPDLGAYEYASSSGPAPPTNLTAIIR